MIKCCLRAIEHYKYTGKRNVFRPSQFDIDGYLISPEKVQTWLKLLRNRVGKEFLQPHWKPSEKQMKALYSALNDANDAISLYSNKVFPLYEEISRKRFDTLESLYNDLKKLM